METLGKLEKQQGDKRRQKRLFGKCSDARIPWNFFSKPPSSNPQQQKTTFNKPNERFKTKVKKLFLYNKFYLKKKS